MSDLTLGVHCSISGGFEKAFLEARRLGISTLQIFTKNQKQWKEKLVSYEEAQVFKNGLAEYNISHAFSHASYLINPATADEALRNNSIRALQAEVIRCHQLGLAFTVLHPGAAKAQTEAEAISRISDSLVSVLDHTAEYPAHILLEITAGQGTSIGWNFSQLSQILNAVKSSRLSVCFDTCHAFAAGYDIRTTSGIEAAFEEADKRIGIQRIKAFHLNDSKSALGSRIDRHAHIGKGMLGLEPFRYILKHFPDVPKVIETPKDEGMDAVNLELLRELARQTI